MNPSQSDADALRAMRRQAEALAAARDPLLEGAVAQLIGIIDALLRVGAFQPEPGPEGEPALKRREIP